MNRLSRRIVLLVLFEQAVWSSLSAAAAPALAPDTEPDALIARALDLRRKGDDQGALPLLQEAFKRSQSARAAGQLGFCHQGLGQWAEAESLLLIAVDKGTDPWVVKNRSVIAQALGIVRSHVARVEVIGEPPGAEVAINANVVGRLPLPAAIHVSNGEVEVEVRAPGYASNTKSFHVDGGQYQRVVLRLERRPVAAVALQQAGPSGTPAPTAPATPFDGPRSTVPAEGGSGNAAVAPDDGGSRGIGTRRSLKWISWAVAAVGAGVGVYGVVKNRSEVASFGRGCGLDPMGAPHADTAGTTDAECVDRKNAYESATVVAVAGFIGTAAFMAAGFVLWATEPEASSSSAVASRWCGPSLGPRLEPGVGCSLRF